MDDESATCVRNAGNGFIMCGQSGDGNNLYAFLVRADHYGDTLWIHHYAPFTIAWNIIPSGDGGFVFAGDALAKVDMYGFPVWAKTAGGQLFDVQSYGGGYYTSGAKQNYDLMVWKTDLSGDTIWTRSFPELNSVEQNTIAVTQDGGCIICSADSGIVLTRLLSSGQISWSKRYNFATSFYPGGENAARVIATADGGFAVTGAMMDSTVGVQGYLIKTDASGNLSWVKRYGETAGYTSTAFFDVIEMLGGDFVLAGGTLASFTASPSPYYMRTNSTGDTIWTRSNQQPDAMINSVTMNSDGGFYFAGRTGNSADAFLIATNLQGDAYCWMQNFPRITTSPVVNVSAVNLSIAYVDTFLTVSTSFIMGGYMANWCTNVAVEENNVQQLFSVYPNPSEGTFFLERNNSTNEDAEILILDLSGRKVASEQHHFSAGENRVELKFDLPAGIYFLEYVSGENKSVEKIVIEK